MGATVSRFPRDQNHSLYVGSKLQAIIEARLGPTWIEHSTDHTSTTGSLSYSEILFDTAEWHDGARQGQVSAKRPIINPVELGDS